MILRGADVSVRLRRKGGRIRRFADSRPKRSTQHRALLLVHGFNVSQCGACRAYEPFLGNFDRWPASRRWPVTRVFWPGDANWGPGLKALAYPLKPKAAEESARSLADFLRTLVGPNGGPAELALVGHSLGCRLVLELLLQLKGSARPSEGPPLPRVQMICLMAAAVPVHMLIDHGALRPAAGQARRVLFLYSPRDRILRWVFPMGQWAAGLRGAGEASRQAVGLHGEPRKLADRRRRVFKDDGRGRKKSGAKHEDYWPSRQAAEDVARYLGDAVPHPLSVHAIDRHELAEARSLGEHRIATRSLGRTGYSFCDGCPGSTR